MTAVNFPDSPTDGQIFEIPGRSWRWVDSAEVWEAVAGDRLPPVEHSESHESGGSDEISIVSGMIANGTITNDDISSSAAIATSKLASNSITLNGESVSLGGSAVVAPSGNAIINGAFEINQRAFTTSTSNFVFTFDRWATRATAGTSTFTAEQFVLGTAPVAGHESRNYIRLVSTGQSGTDARTAISQAMESVRTFAGQAVTLSFWARASSGTPSLAAYFAQNFGTGGSPSSAVDMDGQKISLTTSWNRYSLSFNIPSIAGKTIGTNNNDRLALFLLTSAGSDFDSVTSSLGIQSTSVDIWGVQLESGSVATPFKRNANSLQGELAACQRYYYQLGSGTGNVDMLTRALNYSSATSLVIVQIPYPVTMRANPSLVAWGDIDDGANKSFDTVVSARPEGGFAVMNSVPTNKHVDLNFITASAEL
jgi:hypothetical protein